MTDETERPRSWYWLLWHLVRRVVVAAAPARLNLLLVVAVAGALGLSGQGHDILWSLAAEDAPLRSLLVVSLFAGVAGASLFLTTRALELVWPRSRGQAGRGGSWAPALGASPFAALAVALLLAALLGRQGGGGLPVAMVVAGAVSGGLAVAMILGGRAFDRLLARRQWGASAPPTPGAPSMPVKAMLAVTQISTGRRRTDLLVSGLLLGLGAIAAGLVVLAVLDPGAYVRLGPVPTILAAVAAWSLLLAPVYLAAVRIRLPFFWILLAVIVASSVTNDNHEVRRAVGAPAPDPPPLAEAFEDWLAARPEIAPTASGRLPVFLVATAGGGIRNAYWTAGVLGTLADEVPGFAERVFLVSGVSGGSVGATVYAGLQQDPDAGPVRDRATRVLERDLLSPVLSRALLPDALQRLVPVPIGVLDRARALEDELAAVFAEVEGRDALAAPFMALATGAPATVPCLVLNSTHVESGARRPFSHVALATPRHLAPAEDVPATVAAFASARFPIVTPAARLTLPDGAVRLVDGGYFENSGIDTLTDVLDALVDGVRDPAVPVELHVLTIKYNEPGTPGTPGIAGELLSPVRTLLATRSARGRLAADRLRTRLAALGAEAVGPVRLAVSPRVIEIDLEPTEDGRVPLGWRLSRRAKAVMDAQLDALDAVDAVRAIVDDAPPSPGLRRAAD